MGACNDCLFEGYVGLTRGNIQNWCFASKLIGIISHKSDLNYLRMS